MTWECAEIAKKKMTEAKAIQPRARRFMVQSFHPKQDGVKIAEFELATSIQHERHVVTEAIN